MKYFTIYDAADDQPTGKFSTLQAVLGQVCVMAQLAGHRQVRISMEPTRADVFSTGAKPELIYTVELEEKVAKSEKPKFVVRGRPGSGRWNRLDKTQPNKLELQKLQNFMALHDERPIVGEYFLAVISVDGEVDDVRMLPPVKKLAELYLNNDLKSAASYALACKWVDANPPPSHLNTAGFVVYQRTKVQGVVCNVAKAHRYA